MPHQIDDLTKQIAFEQFVRALQRALFITPVGWLVALWMAWEQVPSKAIGFWAASSLGFWLVSISLTVYIRSNGSRVKDHDIQAKFVSFLDGLSWGMPIIFLTTYTSRLDGALAALVCGVLAVNVPVYLTNLSALRFQVTGIWIGILLAKLLGGGPQGDILFGLACLYAAILWYLPPIEARVIDGIRLNEANAQLSEKLRVHLQAAEEEAATDPLTGIMNRRALDRIFTREINSNQEHSPLSVLVIDFDHFKAINDNHGHGAGDEVLRTFAQRVRGLLRPGDHFARVGGEEFIVLLPHAAISGALEVAKRLRVAIEQAPLCFDPIINMTVSIGVAEYIPQETAEQTIMRADAAAYEAKRNGRNTVAFAAST